MRKMRLRSTLALTAVVLVAVGCGYDPHPTATHDGASLSSPSASTSGRYKIGSPYQIKGVWYYPKVDYDYSETGIASWYGPKFHGKTTANGEIFNQNALTAAHRTLPLPSMVQVTNLENGRQIKLRVNDRGPYARGRIIDVSARAAKLLGFQDQGTAKVRVRIVESDSRQMAALAQGRANTGAQPNAAPTVGVEAADLDGNSAPTPSQSVRASSTDSGMRVAGQMPQPSGKVTYVQVSGNPEIFIQAGAFVKYANARRLSSDLTSLGPTQIQTANVKDRTFYRVRLGPMKNAEEADTLLTRLANRGHPEAQVIVD